MEITLTRDSVHISDDIDAPHTKSLVLETLTVQELFKEIKRIEYLPTVMGNCSWGITGYGPIGLIVQQWNELRPLLNGDMLLEMELKRTGNRLHLCCFGSLESKYIEEVLQNFKNVWI